jgi:hypothetical protein
MIQDTTCIDLTSHPGTSGIGYLDNTKCQVRSLYINLAGGIISVDDTVIEKLYSDPEYSELVL